MPSDLFYITTPIYYVNDHPHIGTVYTSVIADIFVRYQKLFGKETFFLTGTDEHGQKCEKAAKTRGLSPESHCEEMSKKFQEVFKEFGVEYNLFLRTSFSWHKETVQKVFQKLFDQGDIYKDTYKGWYSVSEEVFYTGKDLVDNRSPTGKEVIPIEEVNYFFRMSKYQNALVEYIKKHPQFIQPDSKRNEVLGFLKKPLQDLCVSRPKKRLAWGVELPFDSHFVSYVWVDALLNYLSGIGFLRQEQEFEKWWPSGAIHLIGKDILITHGVYWPCLLLALDLSLPKTLFAHGWLLNASGDKMSKSEGATLNPMELKQRFGLDSLRYFLARKVHLGNDADISESLIQEVIDQDLSNSLGNLLSRVSRLVENHFDGKVEGEGSQEFQNLSEALVLKCQNHIESFELSHALEEVQKLLSRLNAYLEEKAPWKLIKENRESTEEVLYTALEVLRFCGILLQPVMPKKMEELLKPFQPKPLKLEDLHWGELSLKHPLSHLQPLFPKSGL